MKKNFIILTKFYLLLLPCLLLMSQVLWQAYLGLVYSVILFVVLNKKKAYMRSVVRAYNYMFPFDKLED